MAEWTCKNCGKVAEPHMQACVACGAPKLAKKKWGCLKIFFLGLLAVIALPIIVILFSRADTRAELEAAAAQGETAVEDGTPPAERAAPVQPAKVASAWSYDESKDEMAGTATKFAFITANEKMKFAFPYGGGVTTTLTLRKHPRHGLDAILKISKGQFICGIDQCQVLVKFDEGAPAKYRAVPPADHDSTTLFLEPTKKLVDGINKSKQMRIEATFYQEGNRVMIFNTDGLEWN